MQHLRTFLAACATLMFVASPLAAQENWGRGGVEISPFYGVWNGIGFTEDDFEDEPDAVLIDIDNNHYFGGRLGYVTNVGLGIEGYFGYLPGADIDLPFGESEVDGTQYGGNVVWNFQPETALQIFVTAGAGSQKFDIGPVGGVVDQQEEGLESFFAWNYGGGVKLFFTRNMALRADWRSHIAPEGLIDTRHEFNGVAPSELDDIENPTMKSTEWTAGLSYFIGGPADEDGDGVPDTDDLCPGTPEGVAVDADGCPFDDDGDGVYNYMDDCPDTPSGAAVDETGCPTDGDGDGVFDGIDQCEGTPEGATVDETGCPTDSDGDGVFDGIDQCEDTPEGATVDETGCPMDSDGDGVFDGIDQCPGTPEGREVDDEGCGEFEAALAQGRLVLRNINFAFNSAELDEQSETVLADVAVAIRNAIANNPDITIEVQGHTDAIGSEAYNQQLSEQRAASVRDYVVSVEPSIEESLTTRGYGEANPVATNDTEEGRAENRRVEFVVNEE
ncbi:MAG: OmpA family protein [Gemmatimonadota bacterium]